MISDYIAPCLLSDNVTIPTHQWRRLLNEALEDIEARACTDWHEAVAKDTVALKSVIHAAVTSHIPNAKVQAEVLEKIDAAWDDRSLENVAENIALKLRERLQKLMDTVTL